MFVSRYFYSCSGAQPSQWSYSVSASSTDTKPSGWVKESLVVIFPWYSSAAQLSGELQRRWEMKDEQEGEMTVSHLRDENRLRRSETWSHMALDSLTLSALSLFLLHSLSLAWCICKTFIAAYMFGNLFSNFPDFLHPLCVTSCCTVHTGKKGALFPWSLPSCTSCYQIKFRILCSSQSWTCNSLHHRSALPYSKLSLVRTIIVKKCRIPCALSYIWQDGLVLGEHTALTFHVSTQRGV